MENFKPATVSSSGRPNLVDGEVELQIETGVTLYAGKNRTAYQAGTVYLTSHHVFWIGKQGSLLLAHAAVKSVESDGLGRSHGPVKKAAKIVVHFQANSDQFARIGFSSGGRDSFLKHWTRALEKKSWVPQTAQKQAFSASAAGVSGIINKVKADEAKADKNVAVAFSDLNSLMEKAREMVQLAEKFASSLNKQSTQDKDELSSFQQQMGIASPVTKANAGSQYHNQLSRQLADWLTAPGGALSQAAGGMIPLTDLYCSFNRARQTTEMVSPEDLYRACLLLEELGLPARLRVFPSQVSVVQLASATDAQIGEDMLKLVQMLGPLTPFKVSLRENIPVGLAKERLLIGEQAGYLCRDETFEGIQFWPNFFLGR